MFEGHHQLENSGGFVCRLVERRQVVEVVVEVVESMMMRARRKITGEVPAAGMERYDWCAKAGNWSSSQCPLVRQGLLQQGETAASSGDELGGCFECRCGHSLNQQNSLTHRPSTTRGLSLSRPLSFHELQHVSFTVPVPIYHHPSILAAEVRHPRRTLIYPRVGVGRESCKFPSHQPIIVFFAMMGDLFLCDPTIPSGGCVPDPWERGSGTARPLYQPRYCQHNSIIFPSQRIMGPACLGQGTHGV